MAIAEKYVESGADDRSVTQESISSRDALTDAIKEHCKEQTGEIWQYKHFTNLIYKALFGKIASQLRKALGVKKGKSIRSMLDKQQLAAVVQLEHEVADLIKHFEIKYKKSPYHIT
jgi:hypothetical protein